MTSVAGHIPANHRHDPRDLDAEPCCPDCCDCASWSDLDALEQLVEDAIVAAMPGAAMARVSAVVDAVVSVLEHNLPMNLHGEPDS